ncbi:WD40-repeat-containing domain protein [Chiua virens]|nr:WD40-repeat-containing domain protein [Chiua virens]
MINSRHVCQGQMFNTKRPVLESYLRLPTMFSGLRQLLAWRKELNEGGSGSSKGKDREETVSRDQRGEVIEEALLTGIHRNTPYTSVSERSAVSSEGKQKEEGPNPDGQGESSEKAIELMESHPSKTSTGKVIKIDGRNRMYSVLFMTDEKHVLTGGWERRIRCWRIEDGSEVGKPMDMDNSVFAIAVSHDGKWVVSGASGDVKVFDAKSREMVKELKGHTGYVNAVDVSPDGTKIMSGSSDNTVRIWSFSTGEERRRLEHDYTVAVAKFSPNGLLFATATWSPNSVRICDTENDHKLLTDIEIKVGSLSNQSVAWHRNSKHLFVASFDGNIHHIDASTGNTLSRWRIHSEAYPRLIALASDSAYIAASTGRFVSFWDTVTHEPIGSFIEHANTVDCMAVSPDHNIATGAGNTIMVQDLRNILSPRYYATRDLYNKITSVRKRYIEKLHELQAATLAELNRRKRKLAAVYQELDRFPDVSHEILSTRRDLRNCEDRVREIHQQYHADFGEITLSVAQDQPESPPIQHPVADSDVYAEQVIIRVLESLNTGIRRTSMSISTYLIRHIRSPSVEEQSSATQRASMSVPQSLVDHLRTMSHQDLSSYLPLAFRTYLISYFHQIISSWATDARTDKFLSNMFARLPKSASPPFAASWRSLTHTNMPECTSGVSQADAIVSRAIQGLADIAVTADCAASTSDTASKLLPKFGKNILSMLVTAEKLRKLIGEAVDADYKVVLVRPPQTFNENFMVVDADRDSGIPIGRARGKRVLCTTRLGLIKEAVQQPSHPGSSTNTSITSTVVKSSVVLQENRWG